MKIFNLALILFIFFQNTSLFSQSEPINQYNASGKKDGLWSKPINENLCPTDSSNYTYIGLERYVNGHLINSFDCAKREEKTTFIFFPDTNYNKSNKLISGKFTAQDNNGLVYEERYYSKGIALKFISYYLDNNDSIVAIETIDFTRQYNNEIGTFYYEHVPNSGYKESGWMRKGKHGWHIYHEIDSLHHLKFPYTKDYTPPFLGILIGYDFLNRSQLEAGVIMNVADGYDIKGGFVLGPYLSYKRIFENKVNSLNIGLGLFMPLTVGFDVNFNFTNNNHFIGFKPFTGITFYHFQLLYGYNFFNNAKNDILNLNHHSLTLRLTIPVILLQKFLK